MNSQIVSVRFRGKRRDHNFESISLIILVTGLSAIIYQYAFNVKQKMSTWLSSNLSVNATTVLDDFQASKNFNFIADAVEKAAPSVVYIEKIERLPFSTKTFPISSGSGFVVRSDGLVLTNAHVVANKATVTVRLYNGRELEGTVVAVDPVSDLAAIKVQATGLPALKMCQSSKVRAGEWAIAIGSPFNLNNTVTCGVVSSTNRQSKDLGIRGRDMEFIQTDALITFGNSGGPLVNLNGEVIGINNMMVTAGISFAIPADYASSFLYKVDAMLKDGEGKQRRWFSMGSDPKQRRYIGITMLSLNHQLLSDIKARIPDFPDIDGGVLVHNIVIGSPAFSAGLRAGDIITDINSEPIRSSSDVYSMVERVANLTVVVFRGHDKRTFYVKAEDIN